MSHNQIIQEDSAVGKVDTFFLAIQEIVLSFLIRVGPLFIAAMPAMFTSWSVYHSFEPENKEIALWFAIVVGIAVEAVGILVVHTTVDLYASWKAGYSEKGKFVIMLLLVPIYVAVVSGTVYFSGDAFSGLVRNLGIASPFLTTITYTAVALTFEARRVQREMGKDERAEEVKESQTRADELAEIQYQRDKELKQQDLVHAQELARIQADVDVKKSVQQTVQLGHSANVQTGQKGVKSGALDTETAQKGAIKQKLLDTYLDTSVQLNMSRFAQENGVSRQTAYNYRAELIAEGLIPSNGEVTDEDS